MPPLMTVHLAASGPLPPGRPGGRRQDQLQVQHPARGLVTDGPVTARLPEEFLMG
jgi:hypothetical protein